RQRGVAIHFRGVADEAALIRTLVIPAVLFGITAQPFAWLARALLMRGQHGLTQVAILGAAYAWGSGVLTIPAQFTRPAMPILTNLHAMGDVKAYFRLLRDMLLLSLGTALMAGIPMMILAPWIMRAYGPAFAG